MESRPFSSHENNSSDWDDDDDTSPSASKKIAAAVASHDTDAHQPSSKDHKDDSARASSSLFGENSPKTPSHETSLFNSETLASKESEGPTAEDDTDVEVAAELSTDEAKLVVHEYVTSRAATVDAELEHAAPDGPSAAAATADRVLLDHIDAHATSEVAELSTAEMLEQAVLLTAQELGLAIDTSENASSEHSEVVLPTNSETAADDDPDATTSAVTTAPLAHPVPISPHSAGSTPRQTSPPGAGAGHGTPANPIGGSGGGAPTPSPAGAGGPPGGGSPNHVPQTPNAMPPGGGGYGANPNAMPTPASGGNPNTLSTVGSVGSASSETVSQPDRSNEFVKGLLIGGIGGYLLGRRRGRINTEKKFGVVKEKLQKEVKDLQDAVIQKEQQVRRLAAQKAITEQATPGHSQAESTTETGAPVPVAESVVKPAAESQSQSTSQNESARSEQQVAPSQAAETNARKPTVERPKQPLTPQAIERMPLNELLETAKDVVIEGSSLAKLYQSGKIEERALRRVLSEHLKTGHGERQLKAEIALAEQRANQASQVGERRDRQRSRNSSSTPRTQATGQDAWNAGIAVQGHDADQPWNANEAIQKHTQNLLPASVKRRSRNGIMGATLATVLLLAALWLLFR